MFKRIQFGKIIPIEVSFSHTAAFKLGGLFDVLALFSTSGINL